MDSPQEGSVHKVVVGARHDRNVDTLVDYREQEVRLRNLVREERDFPEYVSGVIAKDHAAEVIATNVREDSLEFSYGYLLSTAGTAKATRRSMSMSGAKRGRKAIFLRWCVSKWIFFSPGRSSA